METKVKENGQAKPVNTFQADKTPKFVAGNPVNAVAKKAEEDKAQAVAEPGKLGLNLDQTLKLVADLAKKTALRDRYIGYIDALNRFVEDQKNEADELEDESAFQQCELTIRDQHDNVFSTKSPSVIKGTVSFISGRFAERLAEVEAGIILPA